MRAGLSTIQQTLTADAATVLNHSIAEAGRRNHSQTTPLHVALTILASPSGFLRQACIKSHPNSSHPLQCRALELCFSVALERLPTVQSSAAVAEPPISNALMAALKRAQAHQRRGCPEQQQQPLLAVKVELEQLIISILDDPSVSRIMREARFSSPAVKATIEQSLNKASSAPSTISTTISPMKIGMEIRPATPPVQTRSLYLNPRLQQQQHQQKQQGLAAGGGKPREDEVNKVVDILTRSRKRNPVLVGDKEPEIIAKEFLRKIEEEELGDRLLRNVEVMKFEKEFASEEAEILAKLNEFGDLVAARIEKLSNGGGVIIDLGDLKWLVEQPAAAGVIGAAQLQQEQLVLDKGKLVVAEVGKLLARFEKGAGARVWLIGTATCETYLRCQVYHPSMENDWGLQAVPIAARPAGPVSFPSLGAKGIINPSDQPLFALRNFTTTSSAAPPRRLPENLDATRRAGCCPECTQKCEQEIAKLAVEESGKSPPETETEGGMTQLPQWLRNAKLTPSLNKDMEPTHQQKTLEIQRKWMESCRSAHSAFHQADSGVSEKITLMPRLMTGLCGPNPLLRQPFQPKLAINSCLGESLQLNSSMPTRPPAPTACPPRSPVRTELVLGPTEVPADAGVKKPQLSQAKEMFDVLPSEPQKKLSVTQFEKLLGGSDIESFKKLLKGLVEKVWWQRDAASAIATVMTQCKLGTGKPRGSATKGDTWLLFAGPDRVGKRKMVSALSKQVCRAGPTMISFGSRSGDRESNMSFRGKTVLDRIAEAVRRNPFAVIMLEDYDEANILVRGSIKRAMDTGRIADSYGREISLGNITVILAVNWSPDSQKVSPEHISLSEARLETLARSNWQLKISICDKTAKRRANWLDDDWLTSTKARKEMGLCLGFDLNVSADSDDDKSDGPPNSSNHSVKHGSDSAHYPQKRHSSTASLVYKDLISHVDASIEFAMVDFAPFVHEISGSIGKIFTSIVGKGVSITAKEEAVERIMGGIWLGETGVEEWMEDVLIPCFHQLRARLPSTVLSPDESLLARLETVPDSSDGGPREGGWLPNAMQIMIEGV